MPRSTGKTAFFLLALLFLRSGVHGQSTSPAIDRSVPQLTNAQEISRYPDPNPRLQPSAKATGVVTFVDQNGTTFIRDETGATFFRARRSSIYQPGQTVSVQGVRTPGLYIGGVLPSKVDVLSAGPPPAPRPTTLAELSTGRHHYDLVEIEGIGRSLEITGESTATLRLNVEGGILEVQFDQTPEQGAELIDASLRIRGLAAGAINDHRQLVYPYLRAADGDSITVLSAAPGDPFSLPDTPISSLSDLARGSASHRVRISGTALGPSINGSVFIRSGERAVRVLTRLPADVRAGDPVQALGFPQMGVFSATLADAIVRVADGPKDPVAPLSPAEKDFANGAINADLITLEATVVQSFGNENILIVRTPSRTIRVLTGGWKPEPLAPNTHARFTGIWNVTRTEHTGYRATPADHELWLREPSDIVVLSKPSWWNTRKLSITLGIVAGAGVLILAWAAMLQRQVARQLRVIETKAQREAMIEERQRIAREFHDTLEQELAGLSLRLDAASPRVTDEKARSLLDQLRHLLMRIQTETRDFVWDLRDESQHSDPVEISMEKLIDHLQTTTAIPIRFLPGSVPPLSAHIRHHLLRITREAVNNAVKYSGAKRISVVLGSVLEKKLHLVIQDDGSGFDPASRSNVSGHFGLQGMKERARKIGADLLIGSKPGEGTRVEVVLAIEGAE